MAPHIKTKKVDPINQKINTRRVAAIAKAANDYYPEVYIPQSCIDEVQSGLRPLSPDGLPFIGRHSAVGNLVLATGHSMMGWSLGPATGKLVQEVVDHKKTSMDIKFYGVFFI